MLCWVKLNSPVRAGLSWHLIGKYCATRWAASPWATPTKCFRKKHWLTCQPALCLFAETFPYLSSFTQSTGSVLPLCTNVFYVQIRSILPTEDRLNKLYPFVTWKDSTIVYYVIQTKCVRNADSLNEQHAPLPLPEVTSVVVYFRQMRETEL